MTPSELPNSNRNIVEIETESTLQTHIYMTSLSPGLGTSIKSGFVKLVMVYTLSIHKLSERVKSYESTKDKKNSIST